MTQPTLYIIMRRDIPDMNPGKGMAQAAHAQAEFWDCIEDRCGPDYLQDDPLWSDVNYWRGDGTFGRTLVVHASLDEIYRIVTKSYCGGVVIDPTYPWRNYQGELCVSNEITCAWIFIGSESYAEDISETSSLPLVE
jgi:hypothetical protein